MGDTRHLVGLVAEIARSSPSRRQFRSEVLSLLAKRIGYDDAMFHFMNPTESFDRGHFITTIQKWVIVDALDKWRDRYNPELSMLWNAAAKEGGVVVDTEVLGRDSRTRLRFYREIAPNTGVDHFMWCHLDVHGERVSTVCLARRGGNLFTDADKRCLGELRDVLAIAEKVYQSSPRTLDGEIQSLLTARELEIVDLVVRGLTNPEIAGALSISLHTVRNHLNTIFHKLDVASRAELAGIAARGT